MGEVFGYELVAQALKNEGADTMFFIMGGPMLGAHASLGRPGCARRHRAQRRPTS